MYLKWQKNHLLEYSVEFRGRYFLMEKFEHALKKLFQNTAEVFVTFIMRNGERVMDRLSII